MTETIHINILDFKEFKNPIVYSDNEHVVISPIRWFPRIEDRLRIDCLLFAFCVNGSLKLSLHEKDVRLKVGNCIIIPPGTLVNSVSAEENCQLTLVGYSFDSISELLTASKETGEIISLLTTRTIITYDFRYLNLRLQSFLSILRFRTRDNDRYREELCIHLFATLFFDVISDIHLLTTPKADSQSKTRKRTDSIYKDFLILLSDDHGKNRSVKFYADKLSITPKYLSKIVKEHSSSPALNIIIGHAVRHIKSDLRYTEIPMKKIADIYKFESYSAFCKFFKTHSGYDPQTYRNGKNQTLK